MGGLLQQKAYSQQRALSFFCNGLARWSEKQQGPVCLRSGTPALEAMERYVRNPLFKHFQTHSFQWGKKPFVGSLKVSDAPWHEQALLISQSRQIEWRGGWRFDPTTESRREQWRARGWGEVVYSESFVQSPGASTLPQTVTAGFAQILLCYETCELTRTEHQGSVLAHGQSQSLQLLTEGKSLLMQYIISTASRFKAFNDNENLRSQICPTVQHNKTVQVNKIK